MSVLPVLTFLKTFVIYRFPSSLCLGIGQVRRRSSCSSVPRRWWCSENVLMKRVAVLMTDVGYSVGVVGRKGSEGDHLPWVGAQHPQQGEHTAHTVLVHTV